MYLELEVLIEGVVNDDGVHKSTPLFDIIRYVAHPQPGTCDLRHKHALSHRQTMDLLRYRLLWYSRQDLYVGAVRELHKEQGPMIRLFPSTASVQQVRVHIASSDHIPGGVH